MSFFQNNIDKILSQKGYTIYFLILYYYIGLIFSRIREGRSWSAAGRDHIHHKLMKHFSPDGTLLIILIITLITGLFGIFIENNAASPTSLILFLVYGFIYFVLAHYDDVNYDNQLKKNV